MQRGRTLITNFLRGRRRRLRLFKREKKGYGEGKRLFKHLKHKKEGGAQLKRIGAAHSFVEKMRR